MINKNNKKLTKLEHMTECYYRGILLDKYEKYEFDNLLKGNSAENIAFHFVLAKIPRSWLIFRNIWLNKYGKTEVDLLIVTPESWWSVELKNYSGRIEYKQSKLYQNGQQIRDEIAAARNRQGILENIASEMGNNTPTVCTSILFMDNECDVFCDQSLDIPLVMRYRVERHIEETIQQIGYTENPVAMEKATMLLGKYQIDSPFPPAELHSTDFHKLRTGIYCDNCKCYALEYHYRDIQCQKCQHVESKLQAVLRTTCDLGLLFHNHPHILTMSNIHYFLGGSISRVTIRKSLANNFKRHNQSVASYYHNPGLPLSKI